MFSVIRINSPRRYGGTCPSSLSPMFARQYRLEGTQRPFDRLRANGGSGYFHPWRVPARRHSGLVEPQARSCAQGDFRDKLAGRNTRSTFAFLNQLQEPVEEVFVVPRAWGRLRVVLDAHDRQRAMAQSFNGAIVQVDVADFEFGRQAVAVDGVAVVLGGDVH